MQIFDRCAVWEPKKDSKLDALIKLVSKKHKTEKILVFSQFSDTVQYLNRQLTAAGVKGSRSSNRGFGKSHRTGIPVQPNQQQEDDSHRNKNCAS